MRAFWYIVLGSLVKVDRRFRRVYCLHSYDDVGGTHLSNVGLLQRQYTLLHGYTCDSINVYYHNTLPTFVFSHYFNLSLSLSLSLCTFECNSVTFI
jgi:hypothetical protein